MFYFKLTIVMRKEKLINEMISMELEHCSYLETTFLQSKMLRNTKSVNTGSCEIKPVIPNLNPTGVDFGVRSIAHHTPMHNSILTIL